MNVLKKKVAGIAIAASIIISSWLTASGLSHPHYWTLQTYRLIADGSLTTNKPGYDAFALVYQSVLGIPLSELLYHPIAGFFIIVACFLLAYSLIDDHLLSGIAVVILTLSLSRSVWSYGTRRMTFAFFLFFIAITLRILRTNRMDTRDTIVLGLLYIASNLYYYTAGFWLITFLGTVGILVGFNQRKDSKSLNIPKKIIFLAIAQFVFFLFFTDIIYTGFISIIGSSSVAIFKIFGLIGTSGSEILYEPSSSIYTIFTFLKGIYLFVILLMMGVFAGWILYRQIRGQSLSSPELIITAVGIVIPFEFIMYISFGSLNFRLVFLFGIIILIYTAKEIVEIPNPPLIVILVFVGVLVASIFGIWIDHGNFNRAEEGDVKSATAFLERHGTSSVVSDLGSLTYVGLNTNVTVDYYSKSEYLALVNGVGPPSRKYFLINKETLDEPIRTSGYQLWKPLSCADEDLGKPPYIKIYDSNSSYLLIPTSLSEEQTLEPPTC